MEYNMIIRLVKFPEYSADASIKEDPDGNYNVYVEERIDEIRQRRAIEHEYPHMKMRHLDDDSITAEEAEREAK